MVGAPRGHCSSGAASLLADLGRATMRGVRRCPCCGTLNGTRGSVCKNLACSVSFRGRGDHSAQSACCLACDSPRQRLYSVRHRECGPEVRGFVQLTVLSDAGDCALAAGVTSSHTASAKCHVPSCRNSMDVTCRHIVRVSSCQQRSTVLTVDEGAIYRQADAPLSVKQQLVLLLMAGDAAGPVIQRVSPVSFVVKCSPSRQFPLGYLHVLCAPGPQTGCRGRAHCHCPCSLFKSSSSLPAAHRCVHVYACVCAFLSDPQLTDEFKQWLEQQSTSSVSVPDVCANSTRLSVGLATNRPAGATEGGQDPSVSGVAAPVANSSGGCEARGVSEVNIDVLGDPSLMQEASALSNAGGGDGSVCSGSGSSSGGGSNSNNNDTTHVTLELNHPGSPRLLSHCAVDTFGAAGTTVSDTHGQAVSAAAAGEGVSDGTVAVTREVVVFETEQCRVSAPLSTVGVTGRCSAQSTRPVVATHVTTAAQHLHHIGAGAVGEMAVCVSFHDWLAGVTELINSTMHYAGSGRPAPLVFLVPKAYFSAMKERIAYGIRKRRLPNEVATVLRCQRPPFGHFLQYTWFINNIIHVKSIFDGPTVTLDVTRDFSYCSDTNSYLACGGGSGGGSGATTTAALMDSELRLARTGAPIQPHHYRTVLRVGCMSPQQSEPTPFVIEWVPNLLPESLTGEMTLTFQFVHQHNGLMVPPPPQPPSSTR